MTETALIVPMKFYETNFLLLTAHRQRQHGFGYGKATPLPPQGGGGGRVKDRAP